MNETTGNLLARSTSIRKPGKLATLVATPIMATLLATSTQAVTFQATDTRSASAACCLPRRSGPTPMAVMPPSA